MAELVKWLTRQIVALLCVGSIPTFRPICLFSEAETGFTFSIIKWKFPFFFNLAILVREDISPYIN